MPGSIHHFILVALSRVNAEYKHCHKAKKNLNEAQTIELSALGNSTKCLHGASGYLDDQFCQVEDLQDEASPNFAEEVVLLFFKDSTRLMTNIEQAMEKYPRDFNKWEAHMQQLKGSCCRQVRGKCW
ncbi:hypothetical protein ACP70R_039592 [Stipagrostis hirtigluma subsp. patula]